MAEPEDMAAILAEVEAINAHTAQFRPDNVIPLRPGASEKAKEQAGGFPAKLLHFNEISPAIETNDFVEGLLTYSGMSVIYGETNCGKTFWAADLAFHVAAGWEWSGRQISRGAVLYCSLEGSFGIRNRMAALAAHFDVDPANVPLYVLPVTMDLVTPDGHVTGIEACITQINRLNPGLPVVLVIIDTLSRAMNGGNENGPEDMGALVGNSTKLQQDYNVHVAWIHHSGKDAARGARGHSLLRAATDTEIEITAEGPARCARVTKQRDLDCSGEFAFTLKVVELGTNDRGKPITSCVVDYGSSAALGREHAAGAASALRNLTGHNKRALEVLIDLCAASGQLGAPGLPADASSVPEKWWRDRFYDRAAPGETDEAKQKAFRRSANTLINGHIVGMSNKRVWVVSLCGSAARGQDGLS